MVEPAPGLFSITIGWPITGASSFCTMRAATSVNPPGPKGTMILMGLEGYGCASALVLCARRRRRPARFFSCAVDGIRLGEEGMQDVVHDPVVLLLEAR